MKNDTILTLCKCSIYPYVMYCIDVWGGKSKKNLLSILKLQKRAIRLIISSTYRSESAALFQSLQIFSVFRVHVFELSGLIFKCVNGDVIESIKDIFTINKEIHDYFTCQSNKLHVPKCNKTTTQTNVRFRGVKYGTIFVMWSISIAHYPVLNAILRNFWFIVHHITKYIVASHRAYKAHELMLDLIF